MPLVLAAFVAGDVALQQLALLPAAGTLWLLGGAALLLGGVAMRLRGPRAPCLRWSAAQAAVAGLLAGFVYCAAESRLRMADTLDFADEGRDFRVQGIVESLPSRFAGGVHFTFEVERIVAAGPAAPGEPGSGDANHDVLRGRVPERIALSWYPHAGDPELVPAQRWEWTVRLRRPQATANPAGFDAEGWMFEQGIRALGTVRIGPRDLPPRLLAERVACFDPLVDRARARLRSRLETLLQGRRNAAVIVALVMGDQGGISQDDWSLFNRTGISHLVSISGLHITMIAAAVALATGALWRRSPRLLRLATVPVVHAVAAIAGGLAYCLLAGWGVPAQRTLIMLTVVALGRCLRAGMGADAILAAAAFFVCLWDPWAVLAAGFWLSFGAVACIFLVASGRLYAAGRLTSVREAMRVQAAITVGQVPLTLAIFGQVSLVAPAANALAIPVVSYFVAPVALLGAAFASGGDPLAAPASFLLDAAEWVFGWLAAFLHWLTQPAWSWLALAMPPAWTFATGAAGCAWLLAPTGWPVRWLGVCWLLPMFLWPVERPAAGELWVTALDVGQGMGLVLETADRVVVFDTGPRYSADADAGSRVLVPYLRARGVTRIDALIVSHQDIDHAGGAASLLHALVVGRLWTSVPPGHPLLGGVPVDLRCEAGQRLALGSMALEVLSPAAELYERPRASSNAHSCVVLAQAGAHRVLLTGDVPVAEETSLVRRAVESGTSLRVELLVAPHHGSRSSSSEVLIEAAAPRWVSMQVGYRNHFGHPNPEVVARYREHQVRILRSDESGAVQWRFGADGRVRIDRWRIDHGRYWNNLPARSPDPAG